MKALIDADVLRMEVGAVGQTTNDEGEIEMRSWDFVQELLDSKIRDIMELTWADEYTLFLTSCPRTHRILHRKSDVEFVPNFRHEVATVKPYKGTRKGSKPLHYDNLTAYMLNCHDCVVAEGCEADDLLAMSQTDDTIICTRDKDLRMVPGMHYGWLCGKQPQYGPRKVSDEEGAKFFCTQLLTGDTVDNIPGLPRVGPVKAAAILEGCNGMEECLKAVREAYRAFYGDEWAERMSEQGKLLWMTTEFTSDNTPVSWRMPQYLTEIDDDQ